MPTYYRVLDKGLIGRQDSMFECYIFHSEKGWIPDEENILMDRIIGYDMDSIGNQDIMSKVEKISEEEAMKFTA
jgi:hypothetical protein